MFKEMSHEFEERLIMSVQIIKCVIILSLDALCFHLKLMPFLQDP